MGFFDKLFGRGGADSRPPPHKMKLIRAFAKKRIIQDPMAALQGFSPEMVDQLPPQVLIGLPEATLVIIVESFAALKKRGASDMQAIGAIEQHRAMAAPGSSHPPKAL